MHVSVWVVYVSGRRREAQDSLQLELEAVVSLPVGAISPVLKFPLNTGKRELSYNEGISSESIAYLLFLAVSTFSTIRHISHLKYS